MNRRFRDNQPTSSLEREMAQRIATISEREESNPRRNNRFNDNVLFTHANKEQQSALRQTAQFQDFQRDQQPSALTSLGGNTLIPQSVIQYESQYRSPTSQSGYRPMFMNQEVSQERSNSTKRNFKTLTSQDDYFKPTRLNNYLNEDTMPMSKHQIDMQLHVSTLQQKMKSLESKYIDLANFYKKEALMKKNTDTNRQSQGSEGFYQQNRSLSPLRSGNALDQEIERSIFAELFAEKSSMEAQLRDIMNKVVENHDSEVQLQEKLELLEKEYLMFKEQQLSKPSQSLQIPKVKEDLSNLVNRFEAELLDYINQNYETFTEKDIQDLFSGLKQELQSAIDMNCQSGIDRPSSLNFEKIDLSNQTIQQLSKDYNDFELNMGYFQQKLKKCVFDLQNKHITVLLDLKKCSQHVQILQKSIHDIATPKDQRNSSIGRDNQYRLTDVRRTMQNTYSPRGPLLDPKQLEDVQSQMKTLLTGFNSMNTKLISEDYELRNMEALQGECQKHVDNITNSIGQLLTSPSLGPGQPDDMQSISEELEELKLKNQSYLQDLQYSTDKIATLRNENLMLQQKIDRLQANVRNHSPSMKSVGNYQAENPVFSQRINQEPNFGGSQTLNAMRNENNQYQVQAQLETLRSENVTLLRRITVLSKTIDEKNQTIDKLGQTLSHLQTSNASRPTQPILSDRTSLYPQDSSNERLQTLVKLTQRFLISMKKLQKAVHRKEPNVSSEKSEFENTRKELEHYLKALKKEGGEMISPKRLDSIPQNDNVVHVNRISPFSNDRTYSNERPSMSNSQVLRQTAGTIRDVRDLSQNKQAQNTTLMGTSTVLYDHSTIKQEPYQSINPYQRTIRDTLDEKPISLRQQDHSRNRLPSQVHRSIETMERRSANRLLYEQSNFHNRSPSVGEYPQTNFNPNLRTSPYSQREGNLQSEVIQLRQELKHAKFNHEELLIKVQRLEIDKDKLQLEKQRLTSEIEKERSQPRQHYSSDELRILSDKIEALTTEIQEVQAVRDQLHQKLIVQDQLNLEQKKTIELLEESANRARYTIGEQQDLMQEKEKGIQDLKEKCDILRKSSMNIKQMNSSMSEGELRKLRSELMDKIEQVENNNEDKFAELETEIQKKEVEIGKVRRLLERKIKEREIALQQQQQQELSSQQVLALQSQLKGKISHSYSVDMEEQLSEETSQKQKFSQELIQKQKQYQALQLQYQQEKLKLEGQLSDLQRQNEESEEILRQNLDQEFQQKLEEIEADVQNMKRESQQELKKAKLDFVKEKEAIISEYEKRISDEQAQYQQDIDEKQAEIEQLRTKNLDDQDQRVKQVKERMTKDIRELKDRYEAEALQLNGQIEEMKVALGQQEEKVQAQEEERDRLAQDKAKLESLLKEEKLQSKKRLQTLEQEIAQLKDQHQQDLEQLQSESGEIQRKLEQSYHNKEQSMVGQLERMKTQLAESENKVKTKVQEMRKQKEDFEIQLQNLRHESQSELEMLQTKFNVEIKNRDSVIGQKEKDLSLVQKKFDQSQNDLKAVQKNNESLQNQIDELESIINQTRNDGSNQAQLMQQQMESLKSQLKQKEQQVREYEQGLSTEQAKIKELQEEIKQKGEQLKSVEGDNKMLRESQKEQAQELITRLELAQGQIKALENQLAETIDREGQVREELEELRGQIQDQEQAKEELMQENMQMQSEHKKYIADQKQSYEKQIEGLRMQVNQKNREFEQLEEQNQTKINELELEVQNLQQQIQQQNNKLDQGKQSSSQNQEEINSLKTQLNETEKEFLKVNQLLKDSQQVNSEQQSQIEAQIKQIDQLNSTNESLRQQYESQIKQLNKQLEQDQQEQNQIIQSKDQQIGELQVERTNLQEQIRQLTNQTKFEKQSIEESLQKQLNETLTQLQKKEKELSHSNEEKASINLVNKELQLKLSSAQERVNNLDEQLLKLKYDHDQERAQQNSALEAAKQQITSLKKDHSEQVEKTMNQIQQITSELNSVTQERDRLQEQLSARESNKNSERSDLLKKVELLKQEIDAKQREIEERDQINIENEELLKEYLNNEQAYQQKIGQQDEELKLAYDKIQELEEKQEKHEESLEKLKDLITMLRNQVQKSSDQNKLLEQQLADTKTENSEDLLEKLNQARWQLQEQKNLYEAKLQELQQTIDALEAERAQKDELIEEANQLMEEFNDEKHVLKAKFKHLLQVLDQVDVEQSYKEEDEINLEEAFERFEQEFLKNQGRMKERLENLESANQSMRDHLQQKEEDLAQVQVQLAQVQAELMNANNQLETNDIDMRRKLDLAQRKVSNYKEKLQELQTSGGDIESLKAEYQKLLKISAGNELGMQNLIKEKQEMAARLQEKEAQIKSLQTKVGSPRKSQQVSMRDDNTSLETRIEQIENQIMMMRKQLFLAKDQVIDQVSETFAKKVKDLQNMYVNENIMRGKLSEMKNEQQMQSLNNNVKMVKQLVLTNKRLLVVQVLSNNECYIIDDSKIDESALTFIKQFLPSPESHLDSTFIHIGEKEQKEIDQVEHRLDVIRKEKEKLQEEVTQIKAGLGLQKQSDSNQLREIQLEDQQQVLEREIHFLKLKLNEQEEVNQRMRVRVIELNEILKDLTSRSEGDTASKKMMKLIEDNDLLRQQLADTQRRKKHLREESKVHMTAQEDEEYLEEGAFFQGIQIADNVHKSHQDMDNVNLFDQSSLYNVMEGFNEGEEVVIKERDLKIKKLEQQLEDIQSKNKTLQTELQRSQNQNLTHSEQSVVDNIKGTLIQFLKNCPMTDKNNEILLEIIQKMMGFTPEEVTELSDRRKKARSASVSGGGVDTEEDIKKSAKKGIFGMFKKKGEREGSQVKRDDLVSPMRPIKRH